MNLIYINTHDSGRYFAPYGYAVVTPAIMALARQSTLFRSAFCAAPTCSPSRAAMLTGLSAHESGMTGLAHRGFALAQPRRHLAWFLRGQGFETALCGIQHEAVTPEDLGYEQFIMSDREAQWPDNDILNADAACEFLLKKHDRPFLLTFGMQCTHRIYPVDPERFNPDYVMPPPTVPDTSETREDFAGYLYSVSIADRCVEKLLQAVDEAGLAQDTVVLFTTDHGLPFPGMKCSLHDPGIAVALMLRFPQNPAAGTASDALVSQLDVYPTICDLLSVPKPEWLEGYSLLPVIERGEEVRDELFAEVNYHAAYEPKRCVRTKRWKYIRHFDLHNRVVSANTDDSASKRLLWAAGWRERPVPHEELYDLICDPAEKHNLADDPAHQEKQGEMIKRLQQWMERTNDPLLTPDRRVPKPAGARINTLESTHPNDKSYED